MPCKIMKNCGSGASNKIQTKLACILEADESTRMRIGNSIPHNHENHIAGRVKIHYSTTIWFTNLFLCLKLWKFLQRKQQWTRNGKNWRKFRRGTWRKSKVRNRWSMKQGRRALQFHFASLMDICHLKNAELKEKHQNTKVELYSVATLWKMILGLMQYSLNKDLQHLKWRQLRSWISSPDCQVAMDKQQTQYRLTPKWKWKMLTNYWKFQKSECPDIWIRLPRHKWPKSWSSMEDPVVLLERNLYGHPLAGLLWERQFEKILLKYGW